MQSVIDWTVYKDRNEEKTILFEKMGKPPKVFRLGNLTFYECPPRWITRDTAKILDAVAIFDNKNILPVGTSQADLPLWFMEAYKLYMNEMRPKQED